MAIDQNSEQPNTIPHEGRVTMTDIEKLGERLETLVGSVKRVLFRPQGLKPAPEFNLAQVSALCSKTPDQLSRLLAKEPVESEESSTDSANKKRAFTLAETRSWIRRVGPERGRPVDRPGAVICTGNFKGGVGKTVVSMSLAQGLSLKGYKVLCIDYDPQGSLTSLCGLTPTDIDEAETVLPLMVPRTIAAGEPNPQASNTLQACIRKTYFDGIDLIPGNSSLFAGEFYLPLRQMNSTASNSTEQGFQFIDVLKDALNLGIRQEYDYIILDTPPSLSYMTMTCFWAADALLLPLPAEGLDFQSSAQFWSMLSMLSTASQGASEKEYAWIGAVPSKVDHTKMHTKEILSWMKTGYQGMLLSTEIPETAAVRVGGMKMETVYDISKYVGGKKTLLRARESFDKLVDEVDFLTRRNFWGTSTSVDNKEAA
jgi:chromosome partitioning protein